MAPLIDTAPDAAPMCHDDAVPECADIFINFRGLDQAGFAVLLDARLTGEFGNDKVFLSSRSITPGTQFDEAILSCVRRCKVLFALIGPDWLRHARTENPDLEPEPPTDWVFREIAEALQNGVLVIPILVEGAKMPDPNDLPKSVAPVTRCQYLRLHHRNSPYDLDRIVAEALRAIPGLARVSAKEAYEEAESEPAPAFRLLGADAADCELGVHAGNILRARSFHIWTNSENTDMEMSRVTEFSVSGTIRYWGARRSPAGAVVADLIADELAERIGGERPVRPGTIIVTGPGALAESHHVRHILHVAAVAGEPGHGFQQVVGLERCVERILAEAERLAEQDPEVSSLLLPLLGAGAGKADVERTARIMVRATISYLAAHPHTRLRRIAFVGYYNRAVRIISQTLRTSGLREVTP